ncbi:MAG: hypothetical protein ABSF84_02835 [Acidimicrobiales bacterium]|jgi:hypothetical protein
MKIEILIDGAAPGRRTRKFVAEFEVAEGEYLEWISIVADEGVLARIPLTIRPGVQWPPLPFADLSALSAALYRRLEELAPPIEDEDED